MRNASRVWLTWLFIAGLATNAGAAEADKSGGLLLAGSGNAATHAPVGYLAPRSHDPQLDEVIQIPDFQVVTFPNGGEPVVFTVPAGVETQGVVVGFSFDGMASGVTGSGTWVSNTCMVIDAPDGSSFGVGGTSNVFPGCGNRDAQWAFHGSGSNTDGHYQSMHDDAFADVFEIPPEDAGDWTFTFVHDWNAGAGVPIVWEDVTVTLHKLPVTDPGAAVSPGGFGFEVTLGDTDSDTLFLSNTGAGDLVWSVATTAAIAAAGPRAHEPLLDEAVHIPDFEVVTFPNGGSPVVFTLPAGVATRGDVVGFSFEGTASGVTGSGTWVSNTCMVIEAPDGTRFGVGGTGNVFDGCGNQDANWDFHGSLSNADGDYASGHHDVFDPPIGDLGDWTFTFVHDWNAVAGVPIVWEDVTVTLHKAPLAACAGEPAAAEWLDVDPVSGVTGEGLTDAVSVLVDSAALAVGMHEAWLCIATNDPRAPMVPVPVELTVFDDNVGAIAGTVTGEGYCSADPAPLAGALVSVQGQQSLVTTTTLADGSYLIEVDEAEAPLTITVTAPGHLDAIATDVPVSAGSTHTLDFSMTPAAACATVVPGGFQESMELGAAADFVLTIGNLDGGVPLGWDVHIAPADCDDPGIVEWLAAGPASGTTAAGTGSEVVVSAETAGLADGVFQALLCVTTDDAQAGRFEVPFELTVIDLELAVLSGTVTSRGACASGASPLAGATVEVQGGAALHQTATDGNGFYQLDINQSESPVAIVVSAVDHTGASQSDVALEAGQVTTVDFELVGVGSDDVACIDLDPESLAAAVPVNDTVDRTLEIGNAGTQPLNWAIDSNRGAARSAQQEMLADGVLLVPQHVAGFAVALDPETGNVLDPEFFAIDGLNLIYHILLHPDGERLLATSQNHNVVYSFDLDGQPLGVFAPAGGEDTDIMRNLRGMAIHPDTGQLLVTSGFWNSVEAFDQDGNYQGTFIPSNSGGIGGPWSIVFRDSDMLVSASGGSIYRYEHDGSFISLWNADIRFPQQIIEIDNGNILAAAFGAPSGAWELAPNGHQIAVHGPLTNLRGVYELPNGNILVTNSGGIHEIDRDGNLVETKLAGNSFMISHVQTRDCSMPDWLTVSPAAGTVAAGGPADTVTVTFDPGELALGTYQGNFCVTSNDPVRPTIAVPVEMTVEQPVENAVIQGTVRGLGYCNNEIGPLAGAEVVMATAAGDVVRTTNAAGFYQASLPETASPVEVSISAPGHQPASAGLTFGGGDTVVQDFDLLLDAPCATTDTDRVGVTLESDTTTTATLVLGNIEGNAALDWTMETAVPAADSRAHFPAVPPGLPAGRVDGTDYGVAGTPGGSRAGSAAGGPPPDAVVPAYSTTGSSLGAGGYVFLDATQPGALTTIADPQPDRVYAATFVDNDFSREYMLASDGGTVQANTLGYIDIASGDFTSLGVIAGVGPGTWTSMKWDHRGATLYASRVNGAGNNVLYTIDPVTLQGTVVGPVVGPDVSPDALLIAIAISPQGLMYGIDIVDNVLLAIDKRTGEAAPIGPLGVNANLAQDMDFDQSTGTLYWAGFASNNSRIFTINTETGWATPLGAVEGNAQLLSFSIAIAGAGFDCDNPAAVDWLAVSPAGGSAAPGALSELELVIDAAGLAPGEYSAGLCIRSNDPLYPLIKVPVEVDVTVPARFTTIEGTVETLGRCEQQPAPVAAAEVTIASQQSVHTLVTDQDGTYSIGIDPDEGPVTITVTAAGQLGDAITGITLPPFEVVAHDFTLVADIGCTTVDQTVMSATVVAGTEQSLPLVLSNDGPRDAAFDITSDGHSEMHALSAGGALFNVLIVSPDAEGGQHPIPPTNLVDDLNAFPGMNAALYTGPIASLTLADVEAYDAVVTTNSASWRALNADVVVGDVLADFVDRGGKVIVHNFAYDHVGFRLAGRFIDESYGPITPSTDDVQAAASMVILASDSPVFDNVIGVEHGELFRLTGSNLTPGAELLAEWSDGVPMVAINDSVMSINAMYSSNGEPADWTGDLDVIVYNGIRMLVGVPVVPVDWLSFNPAAGAVPVAGSHTVEVTFAALPDMPIGTYEATILLTVDDGAFTIAIPVEMEIVDAPVTDGIFRDCFAQESARAGAACGQ